MRTTVMMCSVLALCAGSASAAPRAASRPVTVVLDRNGRTVDHDGESITIPRYGGGDRAWSSVVGCVRQHFAPFEVDVVERAPARGPYITAVVGGLASQLGLDDASTNGVGPYSGELIPNAVVYVFSQVGTGERDVANLCAVAAHEVGHALGLDHSTKCGDIMSYWLDRCGTRRFLDASAPCGERAARACGDGESTQSSYRKLVASVGLRGGARPADPALEPDDVLEPQDDQDDQPDPTPETATPDDPWATTGTDPDSPSDDRPAPIQRPRGHSCDHGHRRYARVKWSR